MKKESELKPAEFGKRMECAMIGAIMLTLVTIPTILATILDLLGGGSLILSYLEFFLTIAQLPFLLMILYGFLMLAKRLEKRLLRYATYSYLIIIIPMFIYIFVGSLYPLDEQLNLAVITVSIILESIIIIIQSIGIIGTRKEMGYYATVLGIFQLLQGLVGLTLIGYYLSILMNLVAYPLTALYFHHASKRYGRKQTRKVKKAS